MSANGKSDKICLICGEDRVVDTCHILPKFFVSLLEGYEYLAEDEQNMVYLCKNHHYAFDHNRLTQEEIDVIHRYKKEFIDKVVLEVANSRFRVWLNPQLNRQQKLHWLKKMKRKEQRFNKWIEGFAGMVFVKNN